MPMCFLPQFLQCVVPSDEHGSEGATTLVGVAGKIHVGFRMPDATHGAEETIALVGAAWWWQGPFWIALFEFPTVGVSKLLRRPPMEKKNGKLCLVIESIIVSIGARALGKDVAYNAE